MSNPPKAKGTQGETELQRLLGSFGLGLVRTPAGAAYDLTNARADTIEVAPLEVLATRPDRGEWLMTLRAEDLAYLLVLSADGGRVWETHIEVKRYKRFSLHSIFEQKFGRSK